MLVCKCCKKEKPENAFSAHNDCVSGYDTSRCKQCKKSKVDWSKVPLVKKIYNRAKSRAKKKGIEFTILLEDIVIPEVCPIFKKPFIYNDCDWTYSIDRIDSTKGYIKGNVCIISNKANRAKNNLTLDELKDIVYYLENNSKGT